MLGLLGAILPTVNNVIDRVIPDKNAAQKAKAELLVMQTKGELDSMLGQLEINKEEAKHSSIWVAGWRPAVGWAGVVCLLYQLVVVPTCQMLGAQTPDINTGVLTTLLMTMLGANVSRSWEKTSGVAREAIKPKGAEK